MLFRSDNAASGKPVVAFARERNNRREGYIGQHFAVRAEQDGLGRVTDSRFGDLSCVGEIKFPLGEWREGETRRDVVVRVEEAPPTTIGYGGGLEGGTRLRPTGPNGVAEEHVEFAPRGFFEVGRSNLWGKNRSLNLFTRASLKARDIDKSKRPPTNLVFLIDVSGSMATTNKLPLVKRGMSLLVEEMTEIDRISIQ